MECKFKVGDLVVTRDNKIYTVTTIASRYLVLDHDYTYKINFGSINYEELTLAVSQFDHLLRIVGFYIRLNAIDLIGISHGRINSSITIEYSSKTKTIEIDEFSKINSMYSTILSIWQNYLNTKNQNFN